MPQFQSFPICTSLSTTVSNLILNMLNTYFTFYSPASTQRLVSKLVTVKTRPLGKVQYLFAVLFIFKLRAHIKVVCLKATWGACFSSTDTKIRTIRRLAPSPA